MGLTNGGSSNGVSGALPYQGFSDTFNPFSILHCKYSLLRSWENREHSLCIPTLVRVYSKVITSCFYAATSPVVYNSSVMLPSAKNDSAPTSRRSCVVYKFLCRFQAR